jgi:alkylated DNA repair dioxygenase AlkB
MSNLFPELTPFPPGFKYVPDFLTVEEEAQLLAILSSLSLKTFLFHGYEAKRKVASFGYNYHFTSRTISEGAPVPAGFDFLIRKVEAHFELPGGSFKQILTSEYPPNSVINWHRDAPPFGIIVGISLAADCVFRLRPYAKEKQTRKSILSFPVARRSLYLMSGEARSEWEHSISPVKEKRYSITLRTLKEGMN